MLVFQGMKPGLIPLGLYQVLGYVQVYASKRFRAKKASLHAATISYDDERRLRLFAVSCDSLLSVCTGHEEHGMATMAYGSGLGCYQVCYFRL